MLPDERDTIAAIATPVGLARRGIVRVSGPQAVRVLQAGLSAADAERVAGLLGPRLLPGVAFQMQLAERAVELEVDLYVWPGTQSYTRQPSVEIHAPASTVVLNAVLRALCQYGARLAEPGEFTLRGVLSGRIDLTQAEAVLGVIDAHGEQELQTALQQMAGGLSTPLEVLKEQLTSLLADLEAGLDFVEEEDVRFLDPSEASKRLAEASERLAELAAQATHRATDDESPQVVLAGPPNAGKSTLFNALVKLAGQQSISAMVSPTAGSTRDHLTASLRHNGQQFQLIDTAGEEAAQDRLTQQVQSHRTQTVSQAQLQVRCCPASTEAAGHANDPQVLIVRTMADLADANQALPGEIAVSAVLQQGFPALLDAIAERLEAAAPSGAMVGATATRCRQALAEAEQALSQAAGLAELQQDELVSMEIRTALSALGRVTGDVTTDDVLDRIFSQFCIGK